MSTIVVNDQSGIAVVQIPGTTGPPGPAGPTGPMGPAGAGALTNAELRASAVPVSGSVTVGGTVAVSNFPDPVGAGAGLTDAELRADPVPVSIVGTVTVEGGGGGGATGGLTDDELRAVAVPVADAAVLAALGALDTGAGLTDTELRAAPLEVTGAFPEAFTDALTDAQLRAAPVPVSGTVTVSNPTAVGLTDTQLRATALPVSGTVTVSNPTALGLTDAQLRATAVPVSGTVTVANPTAAGLTDTQLRATAVSVSGPLTDAALRASAVPVSGTVAISNPTAAPETGLAKDGTDISAPTAMPAGGVGLRGWLSAIWTKLNGTLAVSGTFWQATQPVSGPVTDTQLRATAVPVSGTVAVSNLAAAGLTDTQLRAAVLPTADRALVVGPFTGITWAGGNVLTTENIALAGLFGPDATPLQARWIQVTLANNTDKTVGATRNLVLTEVVGGRTITRTLAALGAATIPATGIATVTYSLIPNTAAPFVPRTANLTVTYNTAPISGSVVVLAVAVTGPLDPVSVQSSGLPVISLVDSGFNNLAVGPTDALGSTGLLAAGTMAFNRTNWDQLRNNTAVALLTSAARTTLANWTTADQVNYNGRAHLIFVEITGFTTGGLTPKIQGKTPAGTYYDILVGAMIVAANTGAPLVLRVGENFTPVANLTAQDRLPRTWRFLATPLDATSITGSIGVAELV